MDPTGDGGDGRERETEPPFEIRWPAARNLPFVFNSPHSGRVYSPEFLSASRLDERAIRRSEDTLVDELFLPAVDLGAPLLRAHFPRAWLDVNREPYELDPRMFSGRLPPYANVRSLRVAGGLGTIARLVSETDEIYQRPLSVEEGLRRIETVYMPYHRTLRRLLAETHVAFGHAVLIDCHSMPSNVRGGPARQRPDFVLGDRHGTSCAAALVDCAAETLAGLGYAVARNRPYAGGFITEHYGRPTRGLHALQVEVNRALYLNEATLQPTGGFAGLKADIARLCRALASLTLGQAPPAEAAE